MASYFGEIIEPNSRSFVTDGEECFLDKSYTLQTVCEDDHSENSLPHEHLIIANGKILSDFAKTFLITSNSKVLERYNIKLTPKDDEGHFSKEIITSTLYKLSEDTLLFVCERLPHVYFTHKLLCKLKPWIKTSSHIIILNSESMNSFKPMGTMHPFIRSLKTSVCTLSIKAEELELPNTISGLPATILSWCQANKKSALAYTVYVESFCLDSFITDPLLQLMKSSDFLKPLVSSNATKLQSIVNNEQLKYSNLYL